MLADESPTLRHESVSYPPGQLFATQTSEKTTALFTLLKIVRGCRRLCLCLSVLKPRQLWSGSLLILIFLFGVVSSSNSHTFYFCCQNHSQPCTSFTAHPQTVHKPVTTSTVTLSCASHSFPRTFLSRQSANSSAHSSASSAHFSDKHQASSSMPPPPTIARCTKRVTVVTARHAARWAPWRAPVAASPLVSLETMTVAGVCILCLALLRASTIPRHERECTVSRAKSGRLGLLRFM